MTREDYYDMIAERQIQSVLQHADEILDFEEDRAMQLEAEPRGTDICPDCGSGHTIESWFWRAGDPHRFVCTDCGARWQSVVVRT